MKTLPNQTASESAPRKRDHNPNHPSSDTSPPLVSGQCAQVLRIIREQGQVPSFELTANRAIPEAAVRINNLRSKGFHVITTILPEFEFRGTVRRKVALYSLGTPEWPAPGFLAAPEAARQRGAVR